MSYQVNWRKGRSGTWYKAGTKCATKAEANKVRAKAKAELKRTYSIACSTKIEEV